MAYEAWYGDDIRPAEADGTQAIADAIAPKEPTLAELLEAAFTSTQRDMMRLLSEQLFAPSPLYSKLKAKR